MRQVAAGEGAVISVQYAKKFGVEVGDTVDIAGVDTTVSLPVLAITRTVSVSNYSTVTIGRDRYIEAFGETDATGFQVFAPTGSDRKGWPAK